MIGSHASRSGLYHPHLPVAHPPTNASTPCTQRRDNGQWELPGGVLDLDETIDEGLSREVSEETGLLVEIDHLTGVYENMTHGIIDLVFRCHVVDGTLNPHRKASEATWLSFDEVRERMIPAFAVRLLDALEDHGHDPAVRTRNGTDLLTDKARS